jgi:signal transduction histidine kinase
MLKAGIFISSVLLLTMISLKDEICEIRIFPWGRFNHFLATPIGLLYFYSLMTFFLTYTTAAYINFIRGYKSATSPSQRKQFKIVLIGFFIGYLGMLDFAVTKEWDMYPFGYLTLTILVSVVAYSIIRYQLWDINLAIKRVSMIILIYAFLIGFSLPVLFPFANRTLGNVISENVVLFLAFSAIFGMIFSTGPFIYAALIRNTFWLKDHITTGLTHELKSPIGTIRGALDLLTDKLGNGLDKDSNSYLEMIDKNTTRLESYVRDLLHVAKIQDGQIAVNKTTINLVAVIQALIRQNTGPAGQKNLRIKFHSPESLSLDGDEEMIGLSFSNVLSNAIKFSPQDGEINIQLVHKNGAAWCTITDKGRGINAIEIDHIFDRFYQGKHSSKGSGIGLTIAKAWVEAHGGKIWAESEGEGKGTKVTFTLPVIS